MPSQPTQNQSNVALVTRMLRCTVMYKSQRQDLRSFSASAAGAVVYSSSCYADLSHCAKPVPCSVSSPKRGVWISTFLYPKERSDELY